MLILDEQTFSPKWSFFLDPTEVGQALLSATLGSEKKSYLIVGTAYCVQDEPESKKGRLLVFDWTEDGKVRKKINIWQLPFLISFKNFDLLKFHRNI